MGYNSGFQGLKMAKVISSLDFISKLSLLPKLLFQRFLNWRQKAIAGYHVLLHHKWSNAHSACAR